MDFIDNLPESTDQERFQRHNRFLRSLKSDTLLIIDNFNVTATQDSFAGNIERRCQIWQFIICKPKSSAVVPVDLLLLLLLI